MRTLLCCLIFLGFSTYSLSQQIQILDQQNRQPVSGAVVFNPDKSQTGISDFDGRLDLSNFDELETVIVQHISYIQLETTKKAILNAGNQVLLELSPSTLDEIVLSVAKFGQQKRDIPQQIVTVTSNDVIFRNPQTAADLLESSGQVYVQKSQLGGGSPMIRGFSTNRLLIAVDGVRFNNAIFRGGNVQNVISIDPFAVDRTEVILGPGSVVYGSDAIGGVMNFYTQKPRFSFKEGLELTGSATGRYASANNEFTGHLDLNFGMKEWAFLTSVTYSDFDDLRMGSHGPDDYLRPTYIERINGVDTEVVNDDPEIQRFTGYDQINFMQKIRYMPSKAWDLDLGLFYTTTSDYPRYDRLIREVDGQLRYAEWYYGPQTWMSGNLQVQHTPLTASWFDNSKLTLSYQRFEESRNDRRFQETTLFETDDTVDALTGALDFTKKLGKHTVFYGAEYIYNLVGSQGKQTNVDDGSMIPDASRYPDGSTWQSVAAYASLQSKFTETLSFQGGLRYNHILLKSDFTENNVYYDFPFTEADINTGALTGSAGLTWQPNETIGWRLNFGTAFRAPNVDDVGKVFDSEPGSVVVPNPDVEPEYAYNNEIGVRLNFDDVLKLDIAGYYTVLKDALVRRNFQINGDTIIDYQGEPSRVQAIQNSGRAEVYGFETVMELNFSEQWQLTAAYNLTDGYSMEEDGSKVPVRHVAPQFGNAHLTYTRKKWKLDAFVDYNGTFDFDDLAPSQQNNDFLYAKDADGNPYSPSWYTFNLAGQYQLLDGLRLTASVENITDQRYRPYSSGIAGPGRNLIMAATYQF